VDEGRTDDGVIEAATVRYGLCLGVQWHPDVLGGCAGTTGPWAAAPSGSPFGTGFPDVTVGDMVTVHRRLIAHLGVTGLHAVVGGSTVTSPTDRLP
jgi:hypothetical protein